MLNLHRKIETGKREKVPTYNNTKYSTSLSKTKKNKSGLGPDTELRAPHSHTHTPVSFWSGAHGLPTRGLTLPHRMHRAENQNDGISSYFQPLLLEIPSLTIIPLCFCGHIKLAIKKKNILPTTHPYFIFTFVFYHWAEFMCTHAHPCSHTSGSFFL